MLQKLLVPTSPSSSHIAYKATFSMSSYEQLPAWGWSSCVTNIILQFDKATIMNVVSFFGLPTINYGRLIGTICKL